MLTVVFVIAGWIAMAILTGAFMYWLDEELWTETGPLGVLGSIVWPITLLIITIVLIVAGFAHAIKTHRDRTRNPTDYHSAG